MMVWQLCSDLYVKMSYNNYIKNNFGNILSITNLQILIFVVVLFKFPIKYYIINTTALIEIIIVVNIACVFYQNNKIFNLLGDKFLITTFISALFSIFIIITSLIRSSYFIEGELYRFLTFPLLIFSISGLKYNFEKVIKLALMLSFISLIYLILESAIINCLFQLNSDFNFQTHPLSKALQGNYSAFDLDYFKLREDYGFKYWRPFGILGQPHKSSMIFPLAIILLIFLNRINYELINDKLKLMLMTAFLIGAFLSGAKTALFLSLIFMLYDILKKYKNIILFLIALLFIFFFEKWYGNIYPSISDFFIFCKQPINVILFGTGFVKLPILNEYYNLQNESFLVRILFQIGCLPLVIYFFLLINIFIKPFFNKFDVMMIVFLLFSIYHYCLTSEYFIMLLLSNMIIYNYKVKTKLFIANS